MLKARLSLLAAATIALALAWCAPAAEAAVKSEAVVYRQGGTALEGYLAYDSAAKGSMPGIVVFPDWLGITDYAELRARKLAALGYVVLIADLYGQGVHPKTDAEAGAQSGKLRKDPALLRARNEAALDRLRHDPHVDPAKLVAMGYCFGGISALGLARAGADLVDTITFHGEVADPDPANARNIKGHVLVFWGANDPSVTAQAMDEFERQMRATKVDWQVVTYANTVHSFTVPSAGNNPASGAAYNPLSDRRSWEAMTQFLHDTLAE